MSLEFGPYTSCLPSEEKSQAALRLLAKCQSSMTIQEILSKLQFKNPYKKEIEKNMKIYKVSYNDSCRCHPEWKDAGFFLNREDAEAEVAALERGDRDTRGGEPWPYQDVDLEDVDLEEVEVQ